MFKNKYTALICAGVFLVVLLGWRAAYPFHDSQNYIMESSASSANEPEELQGWVERDDSWFYYSGGSAVCGYKEIDGKLYHFDDDGSMTKGFLEVGGFYYFFQENSEGKAAALCDKRKTVDGKIYYFSSKARGFFSTGNALTDQALAEVIDRVDLQNAVSPKEKMERCYRLLLSKCSYLGIGTPKFAEGWEYKAAESMFHNMRGNCYSYAAACCMLARALGIEAEIVRGSCIRKDREDSQHCWVLAEGKYVIDGIYDDDSEQEDGTLSFFWKDYDTLQESMGCRYQGGIYGF